MIFLIAKNNNTGELYRRFFPEGTAWQEVIKHLEGGTLVDLFKSDKLTTSCFKDYFRSLRGKDNNFAEGQPERGSEGYLWRDLN